MEKELKANSDVKSGLEREEIVKYAGGMPPEKDVDQIDKTNTVSARKRAPGSVRV